MIDLAVSAVCWPSSRMHISTELWELIEAVKGNALWSIPDKIGPW